jgi:hypothetical protein
MRKKVRRKKRGEEIGERSKPFLIFYVTTTKMIL